MSEEQVIGVRDLNFSIGSKPILKGVSLSVRKGAVYALVGNNGAGKTTLLKVLLGMETQYQGEIRLFGSQELLAQRRRIGAVMQMLCRNMSLRGKEHLRQMCLLCGADPATEITRVAAMTECTGYLHKRLRDCSDGMYKRILIAGALVGVPPLLILDEPFNAIDPQGMEHLRILLHTLHKGGVTILVTSHILPELVRLATDFGVICEGRMSSEGTMRSLKERGFFRYIYAVDALSEGIHRLEQEHPALCAIPYYEDTIAVISQSQPALSEGFRFCEKAEADTEEILRYYMCGKEQTA